MIFLNKLFAWFCFNCFGFGIRYWEYYTNFYFSAYLIGLELGCIGLYWVEGKY